MRLNIYSWYVSTKFARFAKFEWREAKQRESPYYSQERCLPRRSVLPLPVALLRFPAFLTRARRRPNRSIMLSRFVLSITGLIFAVVFALLAYAVVKFRRRPGDDGREPAQVYGSTQIELAWTVIPILIVVVLFLATARVIHSIQDAPKPENAVEVVAIGHQFWWEFRYPQLGVVTANELHVPVSDSRPPTPTFLTLLSADTDHSFWVPQLAGKTDLIPNRVNHMWMDPYETGIFLGQCAQYCGTQHAKMLLRVYVDSPEDGLPHGSTPKSSRQCSTRT